MSGRQGFNFEEGKEVPLNFREIREIPCYELAKVLMGHNTNFFITAVDFVYTPFHGTFQVGKLVDGILKEHPLQD